MVNPIGDLTKKCRDLYDRSSRFIIWLSLFWLVIFSCVLPHQDQIDPETFPSLPMKICLYTLLVIWVVFFFDFLVFLVGLRGKRKYWKRAGLGLVVFIFPSFRLGLSPFNAPKKAWIPFMGWKTKGRALEKRLTRLFSVPMVFIVLLVLPILGIEYFKKELLEVGWIKVTLGLGSQVIWLAFAIEFSLMIAVAKWKVRYCFKHWIDLAIILLPVILFVLPFLSFLPLARLARLFRLTRYTRILRLKGVGLKAFQALVLISGTQRFGKSFYDRRINKLKTQLEELEEEMEHIREEIAELEQEREERERCLLEKKKDLEHPA